ncbi:DEAD/DEAH box helicase family protein [Maribacter aquivivus]|uniref:DEAD/DEAH box helicase family protein n=1 Tax=Maribacter aquivivus TaxID=228958 RepID=UPI002494C71C|nr:DEAD/DEAH box helicase family protein [Maribacter aquivivus]
MSEIISKKTYKYKAFRTEQIPLLEALQFTKIVFDYHNTFKSSTSLRKLDKAIPKDGIYRYLSISGIVDEINNLDDANKSDNSFLKGIFTGGTNGEHCTEGVDGFFIDLDVKSKRKGHNKNENSHLFDNNKNKQVFDFLESISVFCFRSNSGYGMSAYIHVNGMSEFTNEFTKNHLLCANSIAKLIQDECKKSTKIEIELDRAQSKFRQPRFAPQQKEGYKVKINEDYVTYGYDLSYDVVKNISGLELHEFTPEECASAYVDTARDKYNKANPIETVLAQSDLFDMGSGNWSHSMTSSGAKTGNVYEEGFYIHSETFKDSHGHIELMGKKWLDPYNMTMLVKDLTYNQMAEYVYDLGFDNDVVNPKEHYENVREGLNKAQIELVCMPLRSQSLKIRQDFLNNAKIPTEDYDLYKGYLNIRDFKINPDTIIEGTQYITGCLPEILGILERHDKIVVNSETGSGKSTAFIGEYPKLRPNHRILIITPLNAISYQTSKKHDIPVLIGANPSGIMFNRAGAENIVTASHSNACKILNAPETYGEFDLIVRDEIHTDITSLGYRLPSFRVFEKLVRDKGIRTIGLTGSVLPCFNKNLGYHVVQIVPKVTPRVINQTIYRRDSYRAALTFIKMLKDGESAMIRINSFRKINLIYTAVLKLGLYKKEEILILSGKEEHKQKASGYQHILNHELIPDNIKLVLTTSVIDEGVSINNKGFDHVVMIDANRTPSPTALKQYFGRFRDDANLPMFHHIRNAYKGERDFAYVDMFEDTINDLTEEELEYLEYTKHAIQDPLSSDKLRFDDGSINHNAVAYQEHKEFVKSLSILDYNEFIEKNYNLKINVIKGFLDENIKIDKIVGDKSYDIMGNYVKNNFEDVIAGVYLHSPKRSRLRDKLSTVVYNLELADEVVTNYVKLDIETFTRIVNCYLSFCELSNNPERLMFNDKGDKLESVSVMEIKEGFLKLQKSTLNPESREERDVNKSKYLKELLSLIKAQSLDFDRMDLKSMMRKAKLRSRIKHESNVLALFISANTPFVWDKNKTLFILKSDNENVTSKYMRGWLIPYQDELEVGSSPSVKTIDPQYMIDFNK